MSTIRTMPATSAMPTFQHQALLAFLLLLVATLVVGAACHRRSILDVALLPGAGTASPWLLRPGADASPGGHADVHLLDDGRRLRIDLHVASGASAPHAAANLFFVDRGGDQVHADLSRYDTISFVATCAPANTLALVAPTLEQGISRRGDLQTYRAPAGVFGCSERGGRVVLDLHRMETPQWWIAMFGPDRARRPYRLDQVAKLAVGSTSQSPRNTDLAVDLSAIALHGRDPRWIVFPGAALLLAWAALGLWCLRAHARALAADLRLKLRQDLPIAALQRLALAPPRDRDRDKSAILHVIASRYTDAELDLDAVAGHAGVHRSQVAAVLESELGFSFGDYLDKLRLTEAARLLREAAVGVNVGTEAATISEVAYTVGYNSVSYFNKRFRQEYGCAPQVFRAVIAAASADGPSVGAAAPHAVPVRIDRGLERGSPG